MKLPVEYEIAMKELLKDDYDSYLKSLGESAKKGFRVNKNYIIIEDFKKIFNYPCEEIEGMKGYFKLYTDEKLGNTVFHHAGMIYLQEPSSMLSALCLDVKEGEKILDLCSAPGGKGSQILENNTTGIVVLNETNRSRANVLFSNIERQGFKNAIITSLPSDILAEKLPNYFDKILVDAPCSGEGMFRKDEATILEWNKGLPEYNHKRQLEILYNADKMLKIGGTLVYSTCTFNIIENEKTIYEFAKNKGYEIVKLPNFIENLTSNGFEYNGCLNTKLSRRCFPQNNFGEGQFIAKLIKRTQNCAVQYYNKAKILTLSKQDLKTVNDFLNEVLIDYKFDYKFYYVGKNIYIYNYEMPKIEDGIVSIGVNLGKIEKARLVPHHQFFKAYGNKFKNKLNLKVGDTLVAKYIRGSEIETSNVKKGYLCVFVNNVPIGGGKATEGFEKGSYIVKNLYPKGLRSEIH